MTQDIIEMAREASAGNDDKNIFFEFVIEELEAFAKLVAAKEREACAKECEHTALRMGSEWMAQHCAESIRARGEQA